MPAGKPSQGNAMLYGLITFVVLFLISTGLAITFYLKLDDANSKAKAELQQRQQIANDYESRNLSKIIGKESKGKTSLGTTVEYFNSLYKMITGNVPGEAATIESKYFEMEQKIADFAQEMNPDTQISHDSISVMDMIAVLKNQRDTSVAKAQDLAASIKDMQDRWDLEVEGFSVEENKLLAQNKNFNDQANLVQNSYEQMKTMAEENVQSQVGMFKDKLDKVETQLNETQSTLTETQEEFSRSEESRKLLEKQLESVKPRPDIELEAFKADGKVLSVDAQTGIVYVNIGSCDHVYRGLTFAVFDKNAPMPKDGKGKAEIMLFDVKANVSAAKLLNSCNTNPVVSNDVIVNMAWDKETPYNFVVAGEFDIDGDGTIDPDGREKIVQLIECWGSQVVDKVNVNTDFVVVGNSPRKLAKQSDEDIDLDPLVLEKYEASVKTYEEFYLILYKESALSIPVFDTKRFINLIGYDREASLMKSF